LFVAGLTLRQETAKLTANHERKIANCESAIQNPMTALATRTLLTGFGAFGEVIDNPTERLVRYFENRAVFGHTLKTCVLPVSYRRASVLLLDALRRAEVEGCPFDLVWMLGVASGSPHWRVERFGRNVNNRAPDAEDHTPPPQIAEDGPALIEATTPVVSLVSALQLAGLPAMASDSAGDYLCNHALYTALRHLRQNGSACRAGFLHVPADPDTLRARDSGSICFSFERHIQAIDVTLAVLANRMPSSRRSL
jgi:pyroglutamyl-peptidase